MQIGQGHALDAHGQIGRHRARADQHSFTGGAGHDAAQLGADQHARRCGGIGVVVGQHGVLHAHRHVALAHALARHAVEIHHADHGAARGVAGHQAVCVHAGHRRIAGEIQRHGGAVLQGSRHVDQVAGQRVGMHLELARAVRQQRQGLRVAVHEQRHRTDAAVPARIGGGQGRHGLHGLDQLAANHARDLQQPRPVARQREAARSGVDAQGAGRLAINTQVDRRQAEVAATRALHHHAGLIGEIERGGDARALPRPQHAQVLQPDRQQLGAADVDGQVDQAAGGKTVVGLDLHMGLACKTHFGREDQSLPIAGQTRRAVAAAQHAPEQRIAFQVQRDRVQAAAGGHIGVRAQRRAHRLRHGHRRQVGVPTVVGVEHLAIGGIAQAVAGQVGQRGACRGCGRPGGAVSAVHHAVAVQVAGQRDAQAGGACAAQAEQLEPGFGHAQQGDGVRAVGGLTQHGGAFGLQQHAGPGGVHRQDHGAAGARRLDGGRQLAVAHRERQVQRHAALQRAGPRIAGVGGSGQPALGRAQISGHGRGLQAAIGVVADHHAGIAAVGACCAVQATRQQQAAQGVVAVGDGLRGAAGIGATDAFDAAAGGAHDLDTLGCAGRPHQRHAGIADQPVLAVGKADVLHLALRVQAVARAVRTGEHIALRHPRQTGALVKQALALALQRGRVAGVAIVGLQRPAQAGTKHRAHHHWRAGLGAQRLGGGGEREAQGLDRRGRQPQAGRHLQPHSGSVKPRRHRAQRRQAALVVGEPGVEDRQIPIAKLAHIALPARGPNLGVKCARERKSVVAQLEHGVGGQALRQGLAA